MADSLSPNPLTEEHKQQIDKGIAAANIGLQAVKMAEMAGIDVSQQRQQLENNLEQLHKIKQVYFPNG